MVKLNFSILISLFKRKGAEGKYTKIVSNNNFPESLVISNLGSDELDLIVYYRDSSNWFLLSDKKIRSNYMGTTIDLDIQNLKEVHLAIRDEFKDGVLNKNDFSRLRITDDNGNSNILYLEKGEPYEGIFQVLHFLANRSLRID